MTKLQLMIEGGKATSTQQLAQTLGPMKIPLNEVIKRINDQTAAFQGIKIPVEINVNDKDKSYEISVGSPPAAELIKKELKLEKGSGMPNREKIANVGVEQVIKVAKQKMGGLFDKTLKAGVKSLAGTFNSMGILIEGKTSTGFNFDLEKGLYDKELKEEKIEVSPEKKQKLQEQFVVIQERLKKEQERLKAEAEAKEKEKAAVAVAVAAAPAEADKAGKKAEAPAAGEKKAPEAEKKAAAPEKSPDKKK